MIDYYALSDIGLKRSSNQDSYLVVANKYGDLLAVVCDGIGGGNAGDVASGEVVKYLKEKFEKSGPFSNIDELKKYLKKELNNVNRKVYDLSFKDPAFKGMGTTATGVVVSEKGNICFNLGDSRVYEINDSQIRQLTVDHTLMNQLINEGKITYEESLTHPMKHYLVKAVGIFSKVEFDIEEVSDADYFLLCSDGLCGYCSEQEMLNIINDENLKDCKEKCDELLKLALLKGGYDNITVVVVKK